MYPVISRSDVGLLAASEVEFELDLRGKIVLEIFDFWSFCLLTDETRESVIDLVVGGSVIKDSLIGCSVDERSGFIKMEFARSEFTGFEFIDWEVIDWEVIDCDSSEFAHSEFASLKFAGSEVNDSEFMGSEFKYISSFGILLEF